MFSALSNLSEPTSWILNAFWRNRYSGKISPPRDWLNLFHNGKISNEVIILHKSHSLAKKNMSHAVKVRLTKSIDQH